MRALAAILGAVLGLCVAACERTPPPPRRAAVPPPAYFPEQFPDIPLPPGLMPMPGEDQLALSLGGQGPGAVRRFEVALITRGAGPDAETLLADLARGLRLTGWSDAGAAPAPPGRTPLLWRKAGEILRVETGQADDRTTMRLRLRPAPASP